MRRGFLGCCVAALWLAAVAPALAQEPSPEATEAARERYRQGAQAYAERRYKDAVDLFLAADRLAPNPAFAYNIGLAYEDMGDPDNALMWYRNYLRDLPEAQDRSEIVGRITTLEGRLRDRGVQQVTVLSTPVAATLTIDGERLGVTPWTGQIKPGRHRVELELRGYQDATEMLELPSDHAVDFSVILHAATAATAAAAPAAPAPKASPTGAVEEPPPEPDRPPTGLGRVRPLTWGALGVGVAGLGTALVFELSRSAAVSDARDARTNLEGKDLYDGAKSDQTISRVALGVGSAFAVAGGVLLYLDLSSRPAGAETARAAIGCAGPTCGVTVHGRF